MPRVHLLQIPGDLGQFLLHVDRVLGERLEDLETAHHLFKMVLVVIIANSIFVS